MVACLAVVPAAAEARVIEMGGAAAKQVASCPDNCQAIGQVTGFQVQEGANLRPFRSATRGKVVAFSITLGTPTDQQQRFFTKLFGGKPQVRLSVLKPDGKKYVLVGQSPVYDLEDYYGSTPSFVITPALTVKKDYIVGLTVPTWTPSFAVSLGNDEAWRSSRDGDKCDDVRQKAAQQVRGGTRGYECLYKTARLLYTATMVTQPRITKKTPVKKTPTTTK
jgi:hypothetical protein